MIKTLIISVCFFMYSLANFSMEEEKVNIPILLPSSGLSFMPALEEIIKLRQNFEQLSQEERELFEQNINDVFTPQFAETKQELKEFEKAFLNLYETSIFLQSSVKNLQSFFSPEFYRELEDNIINHIVANNISEKIKKSCDFYEGLHKRIREAEKAANREEPEVITLGDIIIEHAKKNNKRLNSYGGAHKNLPISLEGIVFEKSPQDMLEDFKNNIKEHRSLREKCEPEQDEFILLQEEVKTLSPHEHLTKVVDAVRHARDTYKHFPEFKKSLVQFYEDVDSSCFDNMIINAIIPIFEKSLDDFTTDFAATLKDLDDLKLTFPELRAEIEREEEIHEILGVINPHGYVRVEKDDMQSCLQQ